MGELNMFRQQPTANGNQCQSQGDTREFKLCVTIEPEAIQFAGKAIAEALVKHANSVSSALLKRLEILVQACLEVNSKQKIFSDLIAEMNKKHIVFLKASEHFTKII